MQPDFKEFEQKLFKVCLKVDSLLEDEFGKEYEIYPNRSLRGVAANGSMDGLFRVTTSFTAGYGSIYGRGYLVIIEILTLNIVELNFEKKVKEKGVELFQRELEGNFKDRDLKIVYDIDVYKIIGSFFN